MRYGSYTSVPTKAPLTGGFQTTQANAPTGVTSSVASNPFQVASKGFTPKQSTAAPFQPTDEQAYEASMAKDFRSNIPTYQKQLYGMADENGRNELNQEQDAIKNNANSRGLLYSTMRQGAEAGAAANEASKVAGQRQAINTGLYNTADQIDKGAIDTGLNNYKGLLGFQEGQYQNQLQQQSQQRQQTGQLLGGLGSIAGLAIASDKNSKDNIEGSDKDLNSFLKSVPNKKYDYKDKENGEGKHFGFLAQDMEKHPVGKSFVENTPSGKVVNMGKALGTVLSVQSFLNKKMDSIKGAKT